MPLEIQMALAGIAGSILTALAGSLVKFAEQARSDKLIKDTEREKGLTQRESLLWERQESALSALERRVKQLEEQTEKLESQVRLLEKERDHWRSLYEDASRSEGQNETGEE